jgi:hypothetical protein
MDNTEKPNAFIFKAFIEEEYRLCVCPRVDGKWSENDITYINENINEFDDVLDNELFSIIFVDYNKLEGEDKFKITHKNSHFIKSDKVKAKDLYVAGRFFPTIEAGYQKFYESNDV